MIAVNVRMKRLNYYDLYLYKMIIKSRLIKQINKFEYKTYGRVVRDTKYVLLFRYMNNRLTTMVILGQTRE